jgi:hypothetical protein
LTDEERDQVLSVYMTGLHYIFIFYATCAGFCLLLSPGVGNTSLRKPKSQGSVVAVDDRENACEDESATEMSEREQLNEEKKNRDGTGDDKVGGSSRHIDKV